MATSSLSRLAASERVNGIGVGHPPKFVGDAIGACVAGQIELPDGDELDRSMILQEGVLPSALAPLLPVFFISGGRLLGAAQSLIKGVYQGPLSHLHTFFVVSHDDAGGRIRLDNGSAQVHWPGVADQPVYARVDEALTKAAQAVGARYIKSPLAATNMGTKPATAHPLGGCGMGQNAESGVVNHKCQVFDGKGRGERACRPLCLRRVGNPALDRRKSAAHHYGAHRAGHGASCPRPQSGVRYWPARPPGGGPGTDMRVA